MYGWWIQGYVYKYAMSRQISDAVRNGFEVCNEKSEQHSASLVSVVSEDQTEIRWNPGG